MNQMTGNLLYLVLSLTAAIGANYAFLVAGTNAIETGSLAMSGCAMLSYLSALVGAPVMAKWLVSRLAAGVSRVSCTR